MNDDQSPFQIHPDDHLEARITAYVLGEASPFEAAELEELIAKSPELQLFLNRTRTLHALLAEAETTSNTPSEEWKLPENKRHKVARLMDNPLPVPILLPEKRDTRRIIVITAFSIAASILLAGFLLTLTKPEFLERKLVALNEANQLTQPEAAGPTREQRITSIDELKKAVREMENRVEERRKVLTTISRTKDIIYYGDRTMGNRNALDEDKEAAYTLNTYNELEGEKIQLETQIESLLKYDSDQLKIYASGLDVPDNTVKSLYPQALELKRQIAGLKASGLGEDHPTVKTNKRVLDSMNKDIDESVVNLRTHLQGQLETTKERLSKVEIAKNESKRDALERSIDTQDYVDAKRDFETEQKLLEQMKLKLIEAQMDAEMYGQEDRLSLASNAPTPSSLPVPSEESAPADFGAGGGFSGGKDFANGQQDKKQVAEKSKAKEVNRLVRPAAASAPEPESQLAVNEPTSRGRTLGLTKLEGANDALAKADSPAMDESSARFRDEDRQSQPTPSAKPTSPALAAADSKPGLSGKLQDMRKDVGQLASDIPDDSVLLDVTEKAAEMDALASLEEEPMEAQKLMEEVALEESVSEQKAVELELAEADPFAEETEPARALYARPPVVITEETPAAQDPFSTFSLNISDASFQIALAAIEKGEQPDPSAIKPEQFYNAVDYGDPAPSSLEPVAAAIDQTAHPVIPGRNLVRVALRTASTGRSAAQPLRLTLLVDQSGSMVREDRRAAMETALAQLSTLLTENDQITVIGFSRTPRLLADSLPGNQSGKLADLINQTANEGGTNLEQAITLASELALRHKLDGAQNRIVLFTDGAANLGNADPDRLSKKIETLRQQGLAFDIAGIGTNDLNDNLLAELARHGNGRYYLVGENTGTSFATQLAGAFRPAAENVKVQVNLNPERVGNYKLIGFEKDRLNTEDFRNDSVDAAELAADEAGVAMYQIETLPEGSGEIGEVSVRFRDTASGEMVERTWTIPYDPTTPAFDKAAPQTQLATLSLLAAQKLQGGPLAEAINFRNLAPTIARLKQTYANDPKAQRMLTLIDALK